MSWNDFDKYEATIDAYLPIRGEGESAATQAVTAANKIIYKWFNDGDVFDNTHGLDGWANDLSSYANWLYKNTGAAPILDQIEGCFTDDRYEWLLKELAEYIFDSGYLAVLDTIKKTGSIYDCDGPFRFVELDDDGGEWW